MAQKKFFPNNDLTKRIPPKALTTLLKVSSALATSLDLGVVLQTAIESAVEVLELETGAIYLLDDDYLYLGATTPPLDPELKALLLPPESLYNHPHLRHALMLQQPVIVPNTQVEQFSPAESAICEARRLKSILYIPLLLEEKPTGAIIVGATSKKRDFREEEIDLCRILSYQIALAVGNARLFKSLQQTNNELTRTYDATLEGWSLALEMRDQDTQGHTQRVTQLTVELACRMGISDPVLAHIRRGALLHDIGKMSIPDTILKKSGPLSPEEWSVMKKHPEVAFQFLLHVDYLLPALDIPFCHHEKWDGSGYPRGLQGEEIPLAARIFAVADVFDALTSDRPYRKAWQKEEAVQYIRAQSGRHFDPRVVKTFMQRIENEPESGEQCDER